MKGKTIAITGISSGIGAATAALLKEQGATIIGFDRQQPAANCDEYIPIDLADESSISLAVQQAEKVVDSPIDALCNIAGVPPTLPPALVLQVNFLGLRVLTEAMIPHLRDGAAIVNAASLAGMGWTQRVDLCKQLFAVEELSQAGAFCEEFSIDAENCYEFSKEAVIVWTMQSWNRWQERGIRINAVSPSAVHTPILDDFMQTVAVRARANAPLAGELPSPGQPDEVAAVVAFLCSDDSRRLNGINIPVDGGLLAARTGHQMGFAL